MLIWWNTSTTHPHSSSQLNSPDGWRFRSLNFQIIRLFLHLKFSENQGDGVPWICQDGPLTLPTAAQASSTSTSASARGVTAGDIEAGDEPAGAPQGATARVLRCQSPKRKAGWGGWGEYRHMVSGLFQSYYSKFNMEKKVASGIKHLYLSPQINANQRKTNVEADARAAQAFKTNHFICFSHIYRLSSPASTANSSTIMGLLTIWNIR